MTQQVSEKILRIYRLARHGVGGEKVNAEKILQRMLKQAGLTLEDLESKEIGLKQYKFTCRTKLEARLVSQIGFMITGVMSREREAYHHRGKFYIDLTPAEYAEISVIYGILRKQLQKELKSFYSAFLHAHDIFPPSTGVKKNLTPEELAEAMRMLKMAQTMEGVAFRKQIGTAGEGE